MQERREWLPKPDGSIVAASASKQRRNPRSLSRPTSGDDYYAILQVGCHAYAHAHGHRAVKRHA